MIVDFIVHGRPQQRGSKRSVPLKSGRTVILDDNRKSRGWMQAIQSAAGDAMGDNELIRNPVTVHVRFFFCRPQSHYGTGRNSNKLKPSASIYHSQIPDIDKLLRSLLDGCTGIVWLDDRLVAKIEAWKEWTSGQEGMEVEIRELL